ncbi:AsmA family protein [Porticoccus sp.]|uniref:AsmA family protein n=1 Tax=Porticoccus sp. TaxID=2024853 RepID=UPI003F699421
MKLLKIILVMLLVLVLVVAGGVTFLLFGVDPNTYKPELEKLALQNDLELKIEGDLSWSFFPNLAVRAGSSSLTAATEGTGIPDVKFREANLILDWRALLTRTVRLEAITLDGVDIRTKTAAEAANVAAMPGAAAATQETGTGDLPFELAIDEISLTDSRITLTSPDGPDQVFEQLNFTSRKLNLDGEPFATSLDFSTTLPDQPTLHVELQSFVAVEMKPQKLTLSDARLSVEGLDKLPLTLNFNASYDGSTDGVAITNILGKLGSAKISGTINGAELQTSPALQGELSLQNLILAELPMEPPEGFKKVDISSTFAASEKAVSLTNLKLALDKFNASGDLVMQLQGTRQLSMKIQGDHLILPATSEAESTEQQAALLTPLLAPLALLEGGKGQVELSLASLTADNIRVDNLLLKLQANGKVVQITELSGGVFDGTFKTTARADLGKTSPTVSFTQNVATLDLHQALVTLADQSDIHGKLTMDFTGSSAGDSSDALLDNMNGNGNFSFSELQVDNINVEKSYCEMASLVEGRTLTGRTWPNHTTLQDMQGTIKWQDQQITLPGFTTGVGNLLVSGNGSAHLGKETYDMLIRANLRGDTTSETGCTIKSKSIQNRDIPFRCTGSFAENGKGSCLPDKQFINQLIQGKVQDVLKEKLFDKYLKQPSTTTEEPSAIEEPSADKEPSAEKEQDPKKQLIDEVLRGIFQ